MHILALVSKVLFSLPVGERVGIAFSGGLGGPVEISPDLRAAALQRAMTFDSRGTVRA